MSLTYAYAGDIAKIEEAPDGGLFVFGKATGPDLDLDEQVCDPAWLKSAMPDWMRWGNVREMHGPVLAGVGKELSAAGDDWMLKSECIDPVAAEKIRKGGYKGYSIGIKNARVVKDATAPGGRIVGGTIAEISYVDRPCNPTATMSVVKMVGGQLRPVDGTGEPIPDEAPANPDEAPEPGVVKLAGRDELVALAVVDKVLRGQLVAKAADDGTMTLDGDEQSDIDGAHEALAVIARLIMSEASELADGCWHEIDDIRSLISAACALYRFVCSEQAEYSGMDTDAGGDADGVTWIGLSADGQLLTKRQFSAQQRRSAAQSGAAMPGGRYPIENTEDLGNAIRAVGRGSGDHAAIRRHIVARANALGATDQIPDNWNADGTTKAADPDLEKVDKTSTPDDGVVIAELVKAEVTKATKPLEERNKALEERLAKVLATPVPGGPVLIPTAPASRTNGETTDKVARYRLMAEQASDPSVRAAYQALAAREATAAA